MTTRCILEISKKHVHKQYQTPLWLINFLKNWGLNQHIYATRYFIRRVCTAQILLKIICEHIKMFTPNHQNPAWSKKTFFLTTVDKIRTQKKTPWISVTLEDNMGKVYANVFSETSEYENTRFIHRLSTVCILHMFRTIDTTVWKGRMLIDVWNYTSHMAML